MIVKPRLTDYETLQMVVSEFMARGYSVGELYRILVQEAVVDLDVMAVVIGEFTLKQAA